MIMGGLCGHGAADAAGAKAEMEMLARLCKIKQVWCLPASKGH
jgi:hypothetical protein